MSNRDVLLHKADLLAALHDEGKPVELHHALRVVRELRQALADYEADAIHSCGPDCKRPLCVMRAELAALRAQEPVAWLYEMPVSGERIASATKKLLPNERPLYAAQAPAAVPDAMSAFDKAVADELPRVSHVEYDSHEICKHFAGELRKRIATLYAAPAPAAVPPEIDKSSRVLDGIRYAPNYVSGWNRCRAAMLDAAPSATQGRKP